MCSINPYYRILKKKTKMNKSNTYLTSKFTVELEYTQCITERERKIDRDRQIYRQNILNIDRK